MKTLYTKLLLLPLLIIFAAGLQAHSQIYKNSFLVGSYLNFDIQRITQKDQGGTKNQLPMTYSATLNPRIGFFLMDNLLLGVDVNFTYTKDTHTTAMTTYNTSSFLMGPFMRYYISIHDNIYLFPDVSIGLGLKSNPDFSQSMIGFGAGPGLAFFLSENITLEALAKYNYFTSITTDRTEIIDNLNFNIGMFYYFRARSSTGVK